MLPTDDLDVQSPPDSKRVLHDLFIKKLSEPLIGGERSKPLLARDLIFNLKVGTFYLGSLQKMLNISDNSTKRNPLNPNIGVNPTL